MFKNIFSLLDQLRAIATEGLTYAKNEYDIERYKKLMSIATEQYSDILEIPSEKIIKSFKNEIGCITPKIGVDVMVLREDEKILILKRSDDQTWSLPCGWMDVGETPFETAKRETKEETGLSIDPLGCISVTTKGPNTYPNLAFHQVNILIASKSINKNTEVNLSHEHLEYKWVDLNDDIDWHAGHEILVEPMRSFIKNRVYIS